MRGSRVFSNPVTNIVLLPSLTGYMRLLAKCNDEFSKVVNNRIFKGYETSNFKKVVKFHMHLNLFLLLCPFIYFIINI